MSDQDNQISGVAARLKPWHYIAIGGVCVGAVLLIPEVKGWVSNRHKEDNAAALAAITTNAGEAWQPPAYPNIVHATITKPVLLVPSAPVSAPVQAPATTPLVPVAPSIMAAGKKDAVPDYEVFGQSTNNSESQFQQPSRGADEGTTRLRATPVAAAGIPGGNGASTANSMGTWLKPTSTAGFVATRLAHPWATIEQGRIIACHSVTPMNSELPGFVKAKVSNDVYGADGTTVLINRNSDIFGEIAHGLVNGEDRLFVLWRSVLTPAPDFVRITLNSPAADELGEAGLSGDINHHTWQKIGGALMLSGADILLQGIGAGLGEALSHGGSNSGIGTNLNFYQFQSQGSSLASGLLQNTVTIPDTLHRDQALPCSIFLSGDLDFSSVYSLRMRP